MKDVFKNHIDDDFQNRLKERLVGDGTRDKLRCGILRVLLSADRHIARFDMAVRRYERATFVHDTRTMFVERENMLACIYETLDTAFMVIRMIDPDVFDLQPALDGVGMKGEDASFINDILDKIECVCESIAKRENLYHLPIDFEVAVDEKEGVTFNHHAHWCDFVPLNVEASFFLYFEQVQKDLSKQIAQVPKIWSQKKMKSLFLKLSALRKYLKVLMTAKLGAERLDKKVVGQLKVIGK